MCFWVGKLSKTLTWWPILINQVCWPNRKSSPLKTKCLLPVGTNKVKRNSSLGSPLWYWKFAAKRKNKIKKKIEIWFIFSCSLCDFLAWIISCCNHWSQNKVSFMGWADDQIHGLGCPFISKAKSEHDWPLRSLQWWGLFGCINQKRSRMQYWVTWWWWWWWYRFPLSHLQMQNFTASCPNRRPGVTFAGEGDPRWRGLNCLLSRNAATSKEQQLKPLLTDCDSVWLPIKEVINH